MHRMRDSTLKHSVTLGLEFCMATMEICPIWLVQLATFFGKETRRQLWFGGLCLVSSRGGYVSGSWTALGKSKAPLIGELFNNRRLVEIVQGSASLSKTFRDQHLSPELFDYLEPTRDTFQVFIQQLETYQKQFILRLSTKIISGNGRLCPEFSRRG